MDETTLCPGCACELSGVIESTFVNDGRFAFVVQKEPPDCNWTKCTGCKAVLCKVCRSRQPNHCCGEGRIIDHERARVRYASLDQSQAENEKEETPCPITESST